MKRMSMKKNRMPSHHMSDTDDFSQPPEVLDELFCDYKPFAKKPGQIIQDEVDELMDFLGFAPGTLHCCTHVFPWFTGNVEDPTWLGSVGLSKADHIMLSKPNEPFLFVDCLLLEMYYKAGCNEWMYAVKVMIRDKIAYFPIPIATMDTNAKYLFKEVFRLAQTEEI